MELSQDFLKRRKCGSGGFENCERLGGGFDFPLPAVDRFHGWQEIDTSCELRFDNDRANLSRLFGIREGAKDH